jgi:hypothetical protein
MAKVALAEHRTERRRRQRREIQHYGLAHDAPVWTGPVIRRDPATYQLPSIHHTWRCTGCRQWTMNGAYLVGRCNFCGVARP